MTLDDRLIWGDDIDDKQFDVTIAQLKTIQVIGPHSSNSEKAGTCATFTVVKYTSPKNNREAVLPVGTPDCSQR